MRSFILSVGFAMLAVGVSAQVTLERCQQWASTNYPMIKQYSLVEQTTAYSVSNAKRAYLPQLSLSVQATYQSDVMEFPAQMQQLFSQTGLTIKGLSKEQYRAMLELDQTVWDGGVSRSQQKLATTEGRVEEQNIAVEIYAVKERVNSLFFGVLLLVEQQQQNKLLQELLQSNYNKVHACMANGVATQSDLDQIKVQQLVAVQQATQIEGMLSAYKKVLSIFTGQEIGEAELFEKPLAVDVSTQQVNRPELQLLDAQYAQLDAQRSLVDASTMPRFGLFAQGMYGNPGLNMFKDMIYDRPTFGYIAGVRMQWNFGGDYTKKNSLGKISVGQSRIDNSRELFLFNLSMQSSQQRDAIDQMRRVMSDDRQIIELRSSIRKATEAQLENGVIDINDLVRDIVAENRAMVDGSTHEIELLKQIYDLKNTLNY